MNTSELYYQTGRDYLIHQESVHRQFSDRAISLISFGIAMIAAGVIALNFGPARISYDSGFFILSGIWALMFLGVVGLCIQVLLPRNWMRGTSIEKLHELMANENNGAAYIYLCVADDFKESIAHNQKVLDRKRDAIGGAMMFLALEAFSLISFGALLVWWRLSPTADPTLGYLISLG